MVFAIRSIYLVRNQIPLKARINSTLPSGQQGISFALAMEITDCTIWLGRFSERFKATFF